MADNKTANAGSGGATFATDEIAGVDFPLTKVTLGALDSNDGPVSSSNPMPVSGTVTSNLSATDNAVLDNIDTNTTGLNNTVGTDGAAGPSSAVSIGGTEAGGTFQEARVDSDGHLQVDVLSGGGSGTEYNEDDATPATIVGSAIVMERDDVLSAVTPVEGDWIGLRGTSFGALWVADINTAAQTTSLTLIADPVKADGDAFTFLEGKVTNRS
jgi:hypothetical protein